LFINLGEYEKAIEQFDKSISLNADNAVPYFNKGIAYYLLGNADMAKTCMQKAIELDPQNETYVEKYNSVFQQ
jgi:tetratricopeptide (TPR) repeat protein